MRTDIVVDVNSKKCLWPLFRALGVFVELEEVGAV